MIYKQKLDYSRISNPLTIPGNPLIQDLDLELYNNTKYFTTKVFRGLLEGKSLTKIKKESGHSKNSDTVDNSSRIIQAIRSTTTVYRLNKHCKEQFCFLAKGLTKDCDNEQLIDYLNAKIEEANGISSNTANNLLRNYRPLSSRALEQTKVPSISIQSSTINNLDVEHKPGVYVYSYPQYLSMESISPEGRGLYKIGASGSIARRVERQRRQTEVPEDLVLVRAFYSDKPFELEAKFHSILKAANMHQKTTQGGVEWFSAPLVMIDAIAKAIK